MAINQSFLQELEQESTSTRKILQRVPEEQFSWRPHERSFTLGRLASHIAELTGWISLALTTNDLDFARGDYKPVTASSSAELMQFFENILAKAKEDLQNATDETFMQKWKLLNGSQVLFELPKVVVIRSLINHTIHHRGQLTVYLRLLNIALPGIYGPTADEPM